MYVCMCVHIYFSSVTRTNSERSFIDPASLARSRTALTGLRERERERERERKRETIRVQGRDKRDPFGTQTGCRILLLIDIIVINE
jgi:hypothetical protein